MTSAVDDAFGSALEYTARSPQCFAARPSDRACSTPRADSVHRSGRHKSGFALRFPRISRIRWDKPASEADRMDALESRLNG